MCRDKLIKLVHKVVPGILGIVGIINHAVAGVVFLRQGSAKLLVKMRDELSGIVSCLKTEVSQHRNSDLNMVIAKY